MRYLLASLILLAGCAAQTQSSAPKAGAAHRIVTLMPSFAQDMCAIGAQRELVGVSAYSDAACARSLPVVNNFSSVNAERVVQLRADRVVAIPAQRAIAAPLERARVPVSYVSDDTYADIFTAIAQLGALSGHAAQAARVNAALKARTAALRRRVHYKHVPRVLFVEQALPLWTIGPKSYIATLIHLAGGELATQSLQQPYAQFSDEALLRADPDAIVATSDAHIEGVLGREPWRSLRAVRLHHVFVAADSNMLVRPDPGYVRGLQWLIERFSSL